MDKRDLEQQKAIQALTTDKRVVLNWATSMGKGTAAVKFIKTLPETSKILIVVAETAHKKNWKDEFIKFNAEQYLSCCTIICYASLHKQINTKWNLIIFDEAHHLSSDKRLNALSTLSSERVLALSATLNNYKVNVGLRQTFGTFTYLKVNIDDAIKGNMLPEPKIFLIPLELDTKNQNQVITIEWGKEAKRQEIHCNYDERWKYMTNKGLFTDVKLIVHCTERQKYSYLEENINYYGERYKRTPHPMTRLKWLRFGSERKRFMGSMKTQKAKQLASHLVNKKFICFCTDINQADEIGGKHAIHSKNRNSASLLEDFNNDKIHDIYVVGMLTEGQNLTGIQAGIIIQIDGVLRPFIQKLGRAMRADYPIQYVFYLKNTKDEAYKDNALEGIDPQYITETTLEELLK